MAVERPWPGRPGPGHSDHWLWMLLRAVVAHRPPLPAGPGVVDLDAPGLADWQIMATVSDVIGFGHRIDELLALPVPVDGAGSARAVASVVVRMCREFAERWACAGPLTRGLTSAFEREVDVLEAALNAIATRAEK